jgi:Zn-dependent alcohol dehydrogenase
MTGLTPDLPKKLLKGGFSRIEFGDSESRFILNKQGTAIFEMFAKGGGREIKTAPDPSSDPLHQLIGSVADASATKTRTAVMVGVAGVAIGTGAGVVMAATGVAAGAGITTLGLAETGTAATTAALVTSTETATAVAASTESSGVVGQTITGFTKHGINQVIDREGVGVASRAVLNALRSPTRVIQQADGCVKYIGKDATVVLSQAGRVISAWARYSAGRRITP